VRVEGNLSKELKSGSPDMDIEAGMGPGEGELHAFPAQEVSLAI
jgi:hypothetical protein